ncbi:hypothetical protein QBC35DRAFT_468206 [Podospora australis]|uniref:Uncharacterized protein n=1 Tax=Podospora australis TaxID=1536484 RepID=A0AAN6WLE7_9PEZI|nr:hypothetical protein QBC35DRAFT_468206 [Podospora australis]
MSSTVGRFTASIFSPTQETTLALASLNFDFSLFKVQAPDEYLTLGSCLSEERRNLAEAGSHHVTAQPMASESQEIAKSVTATLGPDSPALKSVLGDKLGIDGTSIWAAATSGNEALCVQLLACMLARFWSPQEAISIWAEIVESRKQEMSEKNAGFEYSELAAMNTILSREQLAEWDSSARAWLRTADKCKMKEQTQLRLIIDNLDATVSPSSGTYESVVEAWISSMKVVDNLVEGIPQSIHEVAALIGISSWHLYPDMVVYQAGPHEIQQRDPLMRQGGLLTVGLDSSPTSSQGVSWALPLAKLRYYGNPVVVRRSFDLHNQHVSFEQLALVILGGLAKVWPEDDGDRLTTICTYYKKLWNWMQKISFVDHPNQIAVKPLWAKHLAYAASKFLTLDKEPRQSAVRLMEFGLRRCSGFLSTEEGPITLEQQLLGFSKMENFLSVMKHDTEAQIQYIRDFISRSRLPLMRSKQMLIIWRTKMGSSSYRWATPLPDPATKNYYRWCGQSSLSSEQKKTEDIVLDMEGWAVFPFISTVTTGKSLRISTPDHGPADKFCRIFASHISRQDVSSVWEVDFQLLFGDMKSCGMALYERQTRGMTNLAAPKEGMNPMGATVDLEDVLDLLDKEPSRHVYEYMVAPPNTLCAVGVIGEIYSTLAEATISLESVKARMDSSSWYKTLKSRSTKIHMDIVFQKHHFIPNEIAFACLAMLETGDQDLDPNMLNDVMGMACGDSIYLSNSLVLDPYNFSDRRGIFRALGNVGKPGVSLLIPPPEPIVRKPTDDEWNLITHSKWNGKENLDLFGKASLQLVLTEYRVPYVTQHRGVRDSQTFFQEATISVYDGATWVGDVDIIKELFRDFTPRISRVPVECPHGALNSAGEQMFSTTSTTNSSKWRKKRKNKRPNPTEGPASRIRTIENWHELLDKPSEPVVVITKGNWIARLATAAMSSQLGYTTTILPENHCDKDCFSDLGFMTNAFGQDGAVIIL